MKEIKTNNYMKKEAIRELPGDPAFPPGVDQRTINEHSAVPEEDIDSNRQGESEIEVNWPEFNKWFIEGGKASLGELGTRVEPSSVLINYTYSYNYGTKQSNDIKPVQLKDYTTGKIITDPYILSSFTSYYNDKIKDDIELLEIF